jgi:hypothetical protein
LTPSAYVWELFAGDVILHKDNLLPDLGRLTPIDGAVIIFKEKILQGLGRFCT